MAGSVPVSGSPGLRHIRSQASRTRHPLVYVCVPHKHSFLKRVYVPSEGWDLILSVP